MKGDADRAIVGLRVVAALLMLIHGLARVGLGIVDDFGGFLSQSGVPLGTPVAWVLTGLEIAGGAALAAGVRSRALALWFSAQLLVGIVLVHFAEGWFVVGAGRGGMEYSVLLIAVLLAVAWSAPVAQAPPRPEDRYPPTSGGEERRPC